MKKILYNFWIIAIAGAALTACSADEPEDIFYQPRTGVGKTLMKDCDQAARMYADTSFVVALGVEMTELHMQLMSGYIVRAHILRVDLSTPGLQLRVALPDNDDNVSGGWRKQTLTEMAESHDEPGNRVAAMINGDFWDTSATLPRGPVHRNGFALYDKFFYSPTVPQQALSFVAVKDDGQMIIADSLKYRPMRNSLKEVTGSGVLLLQNGAFPGTSFTARDPRTAIGHTGDGIVYMLTVDGRQTFYSYGITYAEMASVFKALGCTEAANFDGGGSAQMLVRNPIAKIFQIRNKPSDGSERAVINGWMVTVAEP